ncbi:MAG: hypothetical protein IJW62_03015 [Clostridia bacterium]|nr:hypothetical protein [Clostridia bacterium]
MIYFDQNSLARLKSIFAELNKTVPYAYVPFEAEEDRLILHGETIRISVAKTISEAWVFADPSYKEKIENDEVFRIITNATAGKWLAPRSASDPFWILLAEDKFECEDYLLETLCHELRSCSDFIRAYHHYSKHSRVSDDPDWLRHLEEIEQSPKYNKFFLWSEFNASYTELTVHFSMDKTPPTFPSLAAYLGYQTAESVDKILKYYLYDNKTDYLLARYLGIHRATRDLSKVYCYSRAFQIENLIPHGITKKYPRAFYIANEYQEIDIFEF